MTMPKSEVGVDLDFTMQTQQQSQWCWTAVAVSTSLYFKKSSAWTQCSLVNTQLKQSTCCADGSTKACNQPSSLREALTTTGNLDHAENAPQAASTIKAQIEKNRPLGVRVGWGDGSGHVLMATGITEDLKTVTVQDPATGTAYVAYNTLVNGYQGSGTWNWSYFTQP